jgi:hypothetical protein
MAATFEWKKQRALVTSQNSVTSHDSPFRQSDAAMLVLAAELEQDCLTSQGSRLNIFSLEAA